MKINIRLVANTLWLLLAIGQTTALRTTVTESWPNGFKGIFDIPLTDNILGGWTVTLTFDKQVTNFQIWNADIVSNTNNKVYVVKNKSYNADVSSGSLRMEFLGHTTGNSGTTASAELQATFPSSASGSEDYQCTCGYRVQYLDSWPGNVKARVRIPVSSPITSGWKLFLQFSDPVTSLQIFNGINLGTQDSGLTYKVKNQQYNANVQGELVQEFIVNFNGRQPTVYPRLKNQPECDCTDSFPTTTVQSTTTEKQVTTVTPTGQTTLMPPTTTLEAGWVDGCLVSTCTCGSSIRIVQEWQANVKGEFRIPVTERTTTWNLVLRFSVPVDLQIWNAIQVSTSADRTIYYLRNPDYHGNLSPGQTLHMDFIATYSGTETPLWDAELSQQALCGEPATKAPEPQSTESPEPATKFPEPQSTESPEPASATKAPEPQSTESPDTESPDTEIPDVTEDFTTGSTTQDAPTDPPATNAPASTQLSTESTSQSLATTQPSASQEPTSVPGMPYAYYEVLNKSIQFYEAQRSGDLPESTMRVTWRKDSFLDDGQDVGLDLSGGWFDAGDYVKFGLPMAQTATTLAWGAIEFKDAYIAAGQMGRMLDCLKWATDYFLKCSVAGEFYAQVGDGNADHAFWGRPEEYTGARPSFKVDRTKPGSDVVGETAAVLAAASIVFRDSDPAYADELLKEAHALYFLADGYRGIYSNSIPNAGQFYPSSGYGDELAWAAAWIHVASGNPTFLIEAENHYQTFGLSSKAWAFSWDDKKAGVQMLLYSITGEAQYAAAIQNTLNDWLPGGGIPYTPKGLAYRDQWGVNRYSANMAFLSLVAAKNNLRPAAYRAFAMSQINYMLGDGGRSYVVGFGKNPPNAPHHRSSSCSSTGPCGFAQLHAPGPNPQILNGALIGGPNMNDDFVNDRSDYIYNEVTTDYNAGFQSAVAGVYEVYLAGPVLDL